MGRPKYEVADVLRLGGQAYRSSHSLSKAQLKAMQSIEQCRTAALSGHIDACDQCGHIRISYNSCRNRHCPKCQSLAREAWLEARSLELLPTGYFHLVFTLPSELHDLVRYNERLLYGALFAHAWAALSTLCADPRYLGAQPGMVALLHTWGQNLHYHPHIHCIVPAGGLKHGNAWVAARKKFLAPVRALSSLFRAKFVSALRSYYKAGLLRLDGLSIPLHDKAALGTFLDNLMAKDWVVYAKPPFAGPGHLLNYLGRYTHRVAIDNNRIVSIDEKTVCFLWRDYAHGNQNKTMRLSHQEFIRRFLQHILPARLCKIRYYGILSNRCRQHTLAVCRRALKVKPPKNPQKHSWQERYRLLTGIDWLICPQCRKGHMQTIAWIGTDRAPPALHRVNYIHSLPLPQTQVLTGHI